MSGTSPSTQPAEEAYFHAMQGKWGVPVPAHMGFLGYAMPPSGSEPSNALPKAVVAISQRQEQLAAARGPPPRPAKGPPPRRTDAGCRYDALPQHLMPEYGLSTGGIPCQPFSKLRVRNGDPEGDCEPPPQPDSRAWLNCHERADWAVPPPREPSPTTYRALSGCKSAEDQRLVVTVSNIEETLRDIKQKINYIEKLVEEIKTDRLSFAAKAEAQTDLLRSEHLRRTD